jgi:glycosyltransferase involved in cell wall biosynthesis
MGRIAAVVLCHNESPNIRHCLESVKGWADVYVVDSGSTDGTLDICAEYTPHVFHHPYENHASQWNWALENLPLTGDWVLALDADFVVTPELRRQLESELASVKTGVDGIYVKHDYVFGGGAIRFGGTKQYWLRVIRRGAARPDLSDLVDFRFNVDGTTIQWSGAVVEYNRHDDDITVWTRKQDKFSLRLAVEEELRRRGLVAWEGKPELLGNPDQRFMRLRDIWLKLPLFLRPCIYFLYRYVLMLGFLDGRAGFLYAALQGFWLRVMVDWKIWRIRDAGLSNDELVKLKNAMFTTRDGEVGALLKRVKSSSNENRAV